MAQMGTLPKAHINSLFLQQTPVCFHTPAKLKEWQMSASSQITKYSSLAADSSTFFAKITC
jgi:hypothetical protein